MALADRLAFWLYLLLWFEISHSNWVIYTPNQSPNQILRCILLRVKNMCKSKYSIYQSVWQTSNTKYIADFDVVPYVHIQFRWWTLCVEKIFEITTATFRLRCTLIWVKHMCKAKYSIYHSVWQTSNTKYMAYFEIVPYVHIQFRWLTLCVTKIFEITRATFSPSCILNGKYVQVKR